MLLVPYNLSRFVDARLMLVVFTPGWRASRLLFGRRGTACRIDVQHRVVSALNDRAKNIRVGPGAVTSSSCPHLLEVLLNLPRKPYRLVHSRHPFRVSSASISSTVGRLPLNSAGYNRGICATHACTIQESDQAALKRSVS
jgi:hypothetical protein